MTITAAYCVTLALRFPQHLAASSPVGHRRLERAGRPRRERDGSGVRADRRRLCGGPGAVIRRRLTPFIGYGCVAIVVIAACVAVLHTNRPDLRRRGHHDRSHRRLAAPGGLPHRDARRRVRPRRRGRRGGARNLRGRRGARTARRTGGRRRLGDMQRPGRTGRPLRNPIGSCTVTVRRRSSTAGDRDGGRSARRSPRRWPRLRPHAHRRHRPRRQRGRTAGPRDQNQSLVVDLAAALRERDLAAEQLRIPDAASSSPRTPSGGGSPATCTTARSSGSW